MVTVKYFGEIAEKTKCTVETFSIPEDGFVGLKQFIIKQYSLENQLVKFALNHELVLSMENVELFSGDELAVLPPFAGG